MHLENYLHRLGLGRLTMISVEVSPITEHVGLSRLFLK